MSDVPSPNIPRRFGVRVDPLASAPITIGELADVPAPLAPIASKWAQEVTDRAIHRFATVTLMNAWAPTGDGAVAYAADTKQLYVRRNTTWQIVGSTSSMTGPVTITSDTQGGGNSSQLVLAPVSSQTGEGAQLLIKGPPNGSTADWAIDTYGDTLRFLRNTTLIAQMGATYSASVGGYFNGAHPTHGGMPSLWTWATSPAPGQNYTLLDYAGDVYLNVSGAGRMGFRIVNAEPMYLDANGLKLAQGKDLHFPAYGGGWQMGDGTWLRSTNDKSIYCGGGTFGTEGYISFRYNGGIDGSWPAKFNANVYVQGQISSPTLVQGQRVSGGVYNEQAIFTNPGNTMAGIGWHPGGVAGSIRMQVNSARYHFNNVDSGGYYDIAASSFSVSSTLASKQDVQDLRTRLGDTRSIDRLARMRPIHFRWLPQIALIEAVPVGLPPPGNYAPPTTYTPTPEASKLAEAKTITPQRYDISTMPADLPPLPAQIVATPLEGHEALSTSDFPLHVCGVSPAGKTCGGSLPENPCHWYRTWERGQAGWAGEEIAELYPEAVSARGPDDDSPMIDLAAMVALIHAALLDVRDDVAVMQTRMENR